MSAQTACIIGFIFALAATVLALIFITPGKRRKGLNKFLAIVADIFNFKGLLVEYIIKVLYIFSTLYVIFSGFFMLFSWESYVSFYYSYSEYYGLNGLLLMVLGPILLRITFEFMMMFILLVKNTIQINNKLQNKGSGDQPGPFASPTDIVNTVKQPNQPTTAYCNKCGAAYDPTKGGCPYGCVQQ